MNCVALPGPHGLQGFGIISCHLQHVVAVTLNWRRELPEQPSQRKGASCGLEVNSKHLGWQRTHSEVTRVEGSPVCEVMFMSLVINWIISFLSKDVHSFLHRKK